MTTKFDLASPIISSLALKCVEPEVGKIYEVIGCITGFLEESEESCIIEINDLITAQLPGLDSKDINRLKRRSFETGVFKVLITEKNAAESSLKHKYHGKCELITFGEMKSTTLN